MADEVWFQQLADTTGFAGDDRAPAHLKSKVYSSIVTNLAQSGPLLDLRDVKDAGGHLCVFEHALAMLPVGAGVGSTNPCRICHARVLGERLRACADLLAGLPVLGVPQWLEPADESEEVLKIHEPTPAGRRQRRTNRVAADCFTEAVPERDMTRQPEVDPHV